METKLAEASERAAGAEERAANAQKELLEVQQRLAPRELTEEQGNRITEAVKPYAGIIYQLFTVLGDKETASLAAQIQWSVDRGGWKVHESKNSLLSAATGIVVATRPDADSRIQNAVNALVQALKAEGD